MLRRGMLAATVVVAVAAVLALRGGGEAYRVSMTVVDAGQLVDGNEVRVAGRVVGKVDGIEIADDGRARIGLRIDDERFRPLHRGTRAVLRNSSLSSVAGRFVSLEPGPDDAPAIADRGAIAAEDVRAITDIDEVLNAFDGATTDALQTMVAGTATAFTGVEREAQRAVRDLDPAIREVGELTAALSADRPALTGLLVDGAATATAFAERGDDVTAGIADAATTLGATASRTRELRRIVARAPATLTAARRAFAGLSPLLREARPVVRQAARSGRPLSRVLRRVVPLSRRTTPVLRDLRRTLPPLTTALERLPALADAGVPALQATTAALRPLRPAISDLRAYTPDIVHGLVVGFGGKAASIYDANGHIGRLEPVFDMATMPRALDGLWPLAAPLDGLLGTTLGGVSTGNLRRCPGAATQPPADGSAPVRVPGCDPTQVPPGTASGRGAR